MMLGLRHTNRATLQGLTPQDVEDYLGYLLGDFVWQLTGKSSEGATVLTPAWSQVLLYEFQIRRQTHYLMQNKGISFKDGLKESAKDPVLKERYFTTPVALSSTSKRPLAFNEDGNEESNRSRKRSAKAAKAGGGKGKAGGGGKGKGGKGKAGGGKGKAGGGGKGKSDYCYSYNNSWEKCTRKPCLFKHVCMNCGGKHPVYQCSNAEAPAGETQGKGTGAD